MRALRALFPVSGAAALLTLLCASKCEHATEIVPYVKEICNDTQDNDADGKTDCQDSDCDGECLVSVTINPIAPIANMDTATISGAHFKAVGISVTVSPSGIGGSAVITGDTWTASITQLLEAREYTITAIAADAQGREDTATAILTKQN
jgi:hypothetical protein